MQVWNARLEDGKWRLRQASNWNTRFEFRGGGSIGGPVRVGAVEVTPAGLRQSYRDANRRTGAWLLDAATLEPIRDLRPEGLSGQTRPSTAQPAPAASKPASPAGAAPVWMEMRTAEDLGKSPDAAVRYELRWETWPANRDRPRDPPLPPASMLKLVKLVKTTTE